MLGRWLPCSAPPRLDPSSGLRVAGTLARVEMGACAVAPAWCGLLVAQLSEGSQTLAPCRQDSQDHRIQGGKLGKQQSHAPRGGDKHITSGSLSHTACVCTHPGHTAHVLHFLDYKRLSLGTQWKQWLILFFGAPKSLQMVTAAMKVKRQLLLRRKVMTNLDSILKSIDIALPTKVHLVKALIFPVVRYGCESWIIKKAEHRRIDAFELWCWRRLLRVSWTASRSNQSILKEISPEFSLEGLM